MLLEHGWTQGGGTRAVPRSGLPRCATCRDYGDNDRLTLGRLPTWRMLADELIHAVLYLHIACVVVSVGLFVLRYWWMYSGKPAAEPALGANCAALQRYAAVSQRRRVNGDNALSAVH
jgi:hypothetical protein